MHFDISRFNNQFHIKTRTMKCRFTISITFILFLFSATAQNVTLTSEQIKALTPEWTGERSKDGRPKTPARLLSRLKNISIEEAWGYLRNKGYQNQFEGDWIVIRPDSVMTGVAVTAQYMPL